MLQSFEIWCDYCLKTKYYDDLKVIKDESFIKVNDIILCKSCAENKQNSILIFFMTYSLSWNMKISNIL